MEELNIISVTENIPNNIVEGLWNGDVEEPDKEHLNMIAHSITVKDLDELVSKLRQHKTKKIIEQAPLRSLVILFHAILEKGGELAFIAAKVAQYTFPS
jgi:hypothetical protein